MKYDVMKDGLHWRVEATGGDGSCLVVLFAGTSAKERAYEYAAWKQADDKVDRAETLLAAALGSTGQGAFQLAQQLHWSIGTVRITLRQLLSRESVLREGNGTKGAPYVYRRKE